MRRASDIHTYVEIRNFIAIILFFQTLFSTMLPIFRLEVTLTSVYMTWKVAYFHWHFILKVIKRRILFIWKGILGYHFMFTKNMMEYRRAARNSRAVDVVRESILWYSSIKQFVVQSILMIRNGLTRNKLVLRNHFPWPICQFLS